MDNIKNRIMVDSIRAPKYHTVLGAYRSVWRETFDPSKAFGWNSLARLKNFYRVSRRAPQVFKLPWPPPIENFAKGKEREPNMAYHAWYT